MDGVNSEAESGKMVGGFARSIAVQLLKVSRPPPLCQSEQLLSFSPSASGM